MSGDLSNRRITTDVARPDQKKSIFASNRAPGFEDFRSINA
jgi:hypothetical protein